MRIKWFSLIRITGLLFVLIYHFYKEQLPGGFIGVDIFFTFSGFLITALLIEEVGKTKKIDLVAYLRRRLYRIVPPLVLMLLVVAPLILFIKSDFRVDIGTQTAGALGFVTNWYEILLGGSYESQFIPHLFLHTWSLALEVHYYLVWVLVLAFVARGSKDIRRFKSQVFLVSTGFLLVSYISMLIGTFTTDNVSNLYFSTLSHSFPFFVGSSLAALTGLQHQGMLLRSLIQKWSLGKTLLVYLGALGLSIALARFLPFESLWTYTLGLLAASLLAGMMILTTRILHEKTRLKEPRLLDFLASTSYGVYLFHWPLYLIFSEWMGHDQAVFLTTLFSLILAAFSFYLLEPILQGKNPKILGTPVVLPSLGWKGWVLPLLLVTAWGIGVVTSPMMGSFEANLVGNSLQQARQQMRSTRIRTENPDAVANGATLIGDSVALRASDWLHEALPGLDMDAAVSRNLIDGRKMLKKATQKGTLVTDVIIALGVNEVNDYAEELDQLMELLPADHRLILVTPYDGRILNNPNAIANRTRDYMLKLADQYDYVLVADWHQTAVDNPAIWYGTDDVHFGANAGGIAQGGKLYAKTVRDVLKKAQDAPTKP
ncbi:acyltransferase family protein [Streptococcus danieliae]|uniref:acyltransferase family protein n=1 Tax=Streptococcus danieliae TaxID=747656 RepID=UPI0021C76F50|nr:acyltransferase family protein [Streptococcus danieliae]MCU0082348.1 acyltransferase [Streptococcus danieliae]